MQLQVLGVREFHYVYNRPIVAWYILCDVPLLKELNQRFYDSAELTECVFASPNILREYETVLRFRDTKIFDPAIKAAVRKIHEGIKELIMLRALAGEDRYTIREDTLNNLNEENTWTVEQ